MKFIIVPDVHYSVDNHSSTDDVNIVRGEGSPTQPAHYKDRLAFLLQYLKRKKEEGVEFFISNGDLVYNDPSRLQEVKEAYDSVGLPYYVSFGNHDWATEQQWFDLWGYGRNTDFEWKDYAFILPSTSNEKGDRLAADAGWLQDRLTYYASKKGVFVVTHVPQADRWRNSVDAVDVRKVLSESANLIGVTCSHVHGAIDTQRIDDVVFSMTGHFAHYGRNFYSVRQFEINDQGQIHNELYSVTDEKVISKHIIVPQEHGYKWEEASV